jgi:hypothetical protein
MPSQSAPGVAYIGDTATMLRIAFPHADAHCITRLRFLALLRRGIVDQHGMLLVGRQAGKFWREGYNV